MSDIRIQQNVNVAKVQKNKKVEQKKEEVKPEFTGKAPEVSHKPADEVLGFMANSTLICGEKDCEVKQKKVEVAKYVTPEQAVGIGKSVNLFFGTMEAHVEQAMKEFNLDREAAEDLAMLHFNKLMDDENVAIIAQGERFIT